jgi:hypothetical protein
MMTSFRSASVILAIACQSLLSFAFGQPPTFTIETGGSTATPSVLLVSHTNVWRVRKGNTEPPADWHSVPDAALDVSWLTAAGDNNGAGGIPRGFGYADGDDADAALLSDMRSNYITINIRRSFQTSVAPDPSRHLRLIMDWDDGFVAYLDGAEVARSSNVPGSPGVPHPYDQGVGQGSGHEALGYRGLPPDVFDLGPVGTRLNPGTHILAIQGINDDVDSSDLSLIVRLELAGAGTPTIDGYFRLVNGTNMDLSGINTFPTATRVVVNGDDAVMNLAEGRWSKTLMLRPGINRLHAAALDEAGVVLGSSPKDVVAQTTATSVGGVLGTDTMWTAAMGVVYVTNNNVIVPAGVTLTIDEGVIVLLGRTNSIRATGGGLIEVFGAETRPAFFLPADGTNEWGELSATGVGSAFRLRHAEVVAGAVRSLSGGEVLVEDSIVRDLTNPSRVIVEGIDGGSMTVRRGHVFNYGETDTSRTPTLVEDSLFERFLTDGMDYKTTSGTPIEIRRTTIRHGAGSNTDATDFGPGAALVERCLIHDFPDKGVSIGDGANDTVVRDSLIYRTGMGIQGVGSSGLLYVNNTIFGCNTGIAHRAGTGAIPGLGTGTNNIIRGHAFRSIGLTGGSTLDLTYSDVEGGYPGTGNIDADPLFVNVSQDDFRLSSGSPAAGTGLGGIDMGALFPVGGIPSTPFDASAVALSTTSVRLLWREDADNEDGFLIVRSTDGALWQVIASAAANVTSFDDSGLPAGTKYYYQVRATNSSGVSRFSNMAGATTQSPSVPETFVGGTISENTTWSPTMGVIYVRSNVVISSNVMLTILAGTQVRMTNGVAIRAGTGGVLNVLGTDESKVVISNWNNTSAQRVIAANGTNASLTVRHAEIAGVQVTVQNGATGLIEDCYVHNYAPGLSLLDNAICGSQSAKTMTVRRCHFRTYYETLFRDGLATIEDCLFEEITGDGLDFDGARPGSVLRRSTFRNGTLGNVDAVDVGPDSNGNGCRDLIIEDCLMYNFPFDKGVSVGDNGASTNTVVRNCLIYGCLSGIMAKDNCDVTVSNCTLVGNAWGFTNYNKANPGSQTGGGHTFAYDNILWDNTTTISMWNSGTLTANYNDFGNTNWPGTANIDVNPLFLDPAARDYRLATNSPCIGAGRDGSTLGVRFPVGGIPAHPVIVVAAAFGSDVSLIWQDVSDNESGFVIERSLDRTNWTLVATAARNETSAVLAGLADGTQHFRMRGTNFIGESFNSNIASIGGDRDGDGMPDDWEDSFNLDPDDPDDALLDADNDGATNLHEYQAGTDPRNANSRLGFASVGYSGGDVNLQFQAIAGKAYILQYRTSLSAGEWQNLTSFPAEGATRTVNYTDSVPAGTSSRFYRLLQQ